MSNTQQLSQKMALLDEIGMIMDSLKTIAMLETQQAKNGVSSQQTSLEIMSHEFASFIGAHPAFTLPPESPPTLLILFGSERGFCGDFNARLVNELDSLTRDAQLNHCELIPVGYRLSSKMEQDKRVRTSLKAAGVFAEVESLLSELTTVISEATTDHPHTRIAMLYHDGLKKEIRFESLLSGLRPHLAGEQHHQMPLLNLDPAAFFEGLLQEYVLARLNHILTVSFFSENQIRVQHLESALDQIEKQSDQLDRRLNQVRQEQITEELETILLNSGLNTD